MVPARGPHTGSPGPMVTTGRRRRPLRGRSGSGGVRCGMPPGAPRRTVGPGRFRGDGGSPAPGRLPVDRPLALVREVRSRSGVREPGNAAVPDGPQWIGVTVRRGLVSGRSGRCRRRWRLGVLGRGRPVLVGPPIGGLDGRCRFARRSGLDLRPGVGRPLVGRIRVGPLQSCCLAPGRLRLGRHRRGGHRRGGGAGVRPVRTGRLLDGTGGPCGCGESDDRVGSGRFRLRRDRRARLPLRRHRGRRFRLPPRRHRGSRFRFRCHGGGRLRIRRDAGGRRVRARPTLDAAPQGRSQQGGRRLPAGAMLGRKRVAGMPLGAGGRLGVRAIGSGATGGRLRASALGHRDRRGFGCSRSVPWGRFDGRAPGGRLLHEPALRP